MKTAIVLAALLVSSAAHAQFYSGDVNVGILGSEGALQVRGDAASALYESMTEIAPKRIDGQHIGYIKTGSSYLCTRLKESGSWETSCTFPISRFENGTVAQP